jgi:pimeloyl-ACP methyl ester carboxylesterase|tara:strand:- start:2963 stop:4090 length:1128 start_codon:yes stop_codon:yes gene_type:complete
MKKIKFIRNKKVKAIGVIIIIVFFMFILFLSSNPLDTSTNTKEFFKKNPQTGSEAESWSSGGSFFNWQSNNTKALELNIFYRTFGDIDNPAIVMIHGWPTSSYDFKELIAELENDFYIAVIDTPGYGFSDKPRGNYKYSILDDARLLDFFIKDILKLSRFTLLTHDKGDTVGFAFLNLYQQAISPKYQIDQHIIMNGGIYLPLAKLSAGQKYFPIPVFGYFMTRVIFTPDRFTSELAKIYLPELNSEEQLNISSIFQYQGGTTVLPKTLRYIQDRKKYEETWLKVLAQSDIPITLIWGKLDPIAKTEIADFVWNNYLRNGNAEASYWQLPCSSHYPQNDQPKIIAQLIRRSALDKKTLFSMDQNLECSAILVEET